MNKLPQKLIAGKILVRPHRPDGFAKTASGIFIPPSAGSELEQGMVVMISESVTYLAVNDIVLYPKGSGTNITYSDENYKYLNGPTATSTGDVWAII